MAEIIRMPKMSDTMTEGVIAAWHKKVGDKVKSGDVLAEVETDKATMELESYNDGILLHIAVNEKQSVAIDGMIAIIGKEGDNIEALLKGDTQSTPTKEAPQKETKTEAKPSIDLSSIPAEAIAMPKMSDTMTEGTIVKWHKKVGDAVKSGELLAEVATDKATMEMESYSDGTLLYIGVKEGESVVVDGLLAIIGKAGTDVTALIDFHKNGGNKETLAAEASPETKVETQAKVETTHADSDHDRLKVSPLARKMAEDKGIDVKQVKGSGENGRIVKKDIESFQPSAQTKEVAKEQKAAISLPSIVGEERFTEVAVSQMRKTIARRLAESKFTAPHFYLTMEINMDKAIEARVSMNEISPVKISFNDLVVKASAIALRKHPAINSSWLGDKIRFNQHIHIGIAVAIEDGLLVPVVRFADNKTLSHIAAEIKDLGGKAKNKQLSPADWTGNTFTISNLGMFGIDEFTAIVNPPDACILAVGGIKETAVVKNGQLVPGSVMKVTLSCDHRVVDGAQGAAFLQTLKGLLEDPVRLLV
jgi:pyruvate dehydrogenase E2 component (dihydrolipoamide acetyltransferase)